MPSETPPPRRPTFDGAAREIEKYQRAGIRERVLEPLLWLRAHPPAAVFAVFVLAGIAWQLVAPPRSAAPRDLRVGDCLYIRTNAALTSDRPIGDPGTVARVLLEGGAEQARCDQSHGHEVVAAFLLPADQAEARCHAAFPAYVGIAEKESRYSAFLAMPSAEQIAAGRDVAVCLLARRDGQWLDHHAMGSRE